jgi:hypothetical protein
MGYLGSGGAFSGVKPWCGTSWKKREQSQVVDSIYHQPILYLSTFPGDMQTPALLIVNSIDNL